MSRLERGLLGVARRVEAEAETLNRLDAQAGDGDMGVTMTTAAKAVEGVVSADDERSATELFRACGAAIAREAPSTSGTLVATGLLRAARAADGLSTADAAAVAQLLQAALTGILERGKAEVGAKTMLDALAPAAQAAADVAGTGGGGASALRAAADAADAGARATTGMRARFGRAGWLAERSSGHEDAGARLVAIILDAAAASWTEG
jgi:dihydroxyacetone kinase-like protein